MRQTTQQAYLRGVLVALDDAGWRVVAVDAERVTTIAQALTEAKAVDIARIIVRRDDTRAGLLVVWQAPPAKRMDHDEAEEVIADYSMSLDAIILTVDR